ncbi:MULTISPECIES: AraC family ligand binding domain-containing protein [Mesorhizobium]|uniref:AraC family ligand binding domain-containing protein n=1 Tax=Mesorhizobium TaxID=68287 RepID=UPI001FE37E66|nr:MULTISPECIES: AraC family ligand binding domain-containing protein [Mesorhizobium]
MKHSDVLGGLDYLAADYHRQDFSKHVHNEYLIGLIERGVHDVWCRGEVWHAGSGTVATFAPGEPHFGGAGDDLGWSQKIFYMPEGLIRQVLDDSGQRTRNDRLQKPVPGECPSCTRPQRVLAPA